MSSRPNASTARSTSPSQTPSLVRSPAKVTVSPWISDAASSATSPSRSLISTGAPDERGGPPRRAPNADGGGGRREAGLRGAGDRAARPTEAHGQPGSPVLAGAGASPAQSHERVVDRQPVPPDRV